MNDAEILRHKWNCWRGSDLSYKLHSGQLKFREIIRSHSAAFVVLCCSRRWGKSWFMCTDAVETALSTPNAVIPYACPTKKQAEKIVVPTMKSVLMDCPPELRPRFYESDKLWVFTNGSVINLAGCDKGADDKLRGSSAHMAYLDEAGFIAKLRYVANSIIYPQTLTTGGKVVIASTPSDKPNHSFQDYCATAEARGSYLHQTIWDIPHLTDEQKSDAIKELGGEESAEVRRECYAEHIFDSTTVVVPEFVPHQVSVVIDSPRPTHFEPFVVVDIGFDDLTAVNFCYYDFKRAKLVIEEELTFQHKTSGIIVPAVRKKEMELWDRSADFRLIDASKFTRRDLMAEHGFACVQVKKDDAEAAINMLRMGIQKHKIEINPRCARTISHLKSAQWGNRKRTELARSVDEGHYDHLDVVKYAWRHVDRQHNPFPGHSPDVKPETHHIPDDKQGTATSQTLKEAFRKRK